MADRSKIRLIDGKIDGKRVIKRRLTVPKFNRRRRLIIYKALESGLPQYKAALFAGMSSKGVDQWLARGRRPDKYNVQYYYFRKKVRKIQAQLEKDSLDVIKKAAEGGTKVTNTVISFGRNGAEVKRSRKMAGPNWQAAAWFLERKYPESYGRRIIQEGVGDQGESSTINIGIAIVPEATNVKAWQEKYSPKGIDGKPREIVAETGDK